MRKKKILFVVGSLNQTTQMHQISRHLTDYDCYFTQIFPDNFGLTLIYKLKLTERTIYSGIFKKQSEAYLKKHDLKNDYRAEVYNNQYDLVVMCTELIIPKRFRNTKVVFIQEGMTDPIRLWSHLIRALRLPAWFASTSLNGSLNRCDVYCVASEGYKEKFAKTGTERNKIFVTGIPNFDNAPSYLNNNFIHKDYALVVTTDIRECMGIDNRKKFIKHCVEIAAGRKLIFKLHPNEKYDRAIREIKKYAPADTMVFTDGDLNSMIANCSVLISQYSSVVYLGMALGKEVHSYFDVTELKKLCPVQNNGTSAKKIAEICRNYIEFKGSKEKFLKLLAKGKFSPEKSKLAA